MTIPNQPPNMFTRVAVEYINPALLIPNPKSPRKHSPLQIRKIARSIEAFGMVIPVLVDADNIIYAGHACVEATIKLGLPEIPVVKIDHLSKNELNLMMIALNKLPELSSWDNEKLGQLFLELSVLELEVDVELTGFSVGEIDLMIAGEISKSADKADELPKLPQIPPITQLGDIWQLGPHRLICGNSLEAETYVALFNDVGKNKLASSIFTDPPYNVKIDGHVSGTGKVKHREFKMASGEMSDGAFIDFLKAACTLMVEFSKEGSLHYICMDWRHLEHLLKAGSAHYSELKNICVWVKDNGGMGSLYRSKHEMIAVYKNGKAPHRNNVELGKHGRYRTNVWEYPCANTFSKQSDEGRLAELHPTVKPVKMVADAILDTTTKGEIILDPFLGSGTTLMAAERVGRICYGIELDPIYCDTIIRRWQNYTGDEAIHVASGQTFNSISIMMEASNA
ncbi:MAG: site-specific DNA-methyltransferase [Proteobacteria bacterium]|nr:site-specific DNA-methyltransferase [Pseudomonadota bacterium]